MARFQGGLDARAFDELVSRFISPATAAARHILADPSLAEDAVQETFLRVIRHRARYIPAKPFSSWFFTILRNICKDMLRRRDRQARLVRTVAARGAGDASGPNHSDTRVNGAELLAALPAKARAVLTLRIIHGLAFGDIAAAMGISEEAAKKRAQRALRHLRELARRKGPVWPAPPAAADGDAAYVSAGSADGDVPVGRP